jgi:hypothetical protein
MSLGYGIQPPVVIQLPNDDPIIAFSEDLHQRLMHTKQYDQLGWFQTDVEPESRGWFTCSSNYIVNEDLMSIIPLISKQLNEHGLHVKQKLTSSDFLVEIHYANAGNDPVESGLDIHRDNDGGIRGYLHTLIVYLHVDCQGGELNIYSEREKFLEQIKVSDNTVVMFNGGLYHQPQKITNGKRVAVSYQIRQAYVSYR